MNQEPPPIPRKAPGTWFKRNYKWFLPVICVGGLLLFTGIIALFVYGVFGLLKSSDPYKQALARAKAEPAVIAALGSPIRAGFFVTGSINLSNSSGDADLSFPISGPNGKATVYVVAKKSLGRWTFQHLIVEIGKTGKRIDLPDKEGEAPQHPADDRQPSSSTTNSTPPAAGSRR